MISRVLTTRSLILMYCTVMFMAFYWLFSTESPCVEHRHPMEDEDCPRKQLAIQSERLAGKKEALKNLEQKLARVMRKLRRTQTYAKVNAIMKEFEPDVPTIHAVTPTHARPVQKAELTRLVQTFLHVHNFHWIVVEDSPDKTGLVSRLLASSGLRYTHLSVATPTDYKLHRNDPNWLKPRGVLQRNAALTWLRRNYDEREPGVVYFADDDNTYDVRVFDEMRYTRKVSVWPVGLVGGLLHEGPLVAGSKVVGWDTYWKPDRPFATDMAGFAVSLSLILNHPEAAFSNEVPRGYLESALLGALVTTQDLEPRANECTEVLVWHTRTEEAKLKNEDKMTRAGKKSHRVMEV